MNTNTHHEHSTDNDNPNNRTKPQHLLLWFRNDLRLHDNNAVHFFLEQAQQTPCHCQAIFFITPKQWQQHNLASIKIDLIYRHLDWLEKQLAALNIKLSIIEVADFKEQHNYLLNLHQQMNNLAIVANSEVEINEQTRDNSLIDAGVNLSLFECDVIIPKGRILNQSGDMFKVFTPFKKAWIKHIQQYGFEYISKTHIKPIEKQRDDLNFIEPLQPLNIKTLITSESAAWPTTEVVEQHVIPAFLTNKLDKYASMRDIPSVKGTSGLSPYLAIGAISPRYLLTLLINNKPDILTSPDSEAFTWLNELVWREFYRHLLFHFPKLCKHSCFNDKYEQLPWPNNQAYFKAWCEGKTGYPIVDAAMRQLKKTGWMHNRLRMIVASFLTKHLLIDWHWGEKYFMQHLIDGDLAANNGGWQWAASTGCDAQPYFRIFNPIRQSERFDPDGDFIRKYLPELADIPAKEIHFPHKYMAKNNITSYWPAMVEHKTARLNALAFYKI